MDEIKKEETISERDERISKILEESGKLRGRVSAIIKSGGGSKKVEEGYITEWAGLIRQLSDKEIFGYIAFSQKEFTRQGAVKGFMVGLGLSAVLVFLVALLH